MAVKDRQGHELAKGMSVLDTDGQGGFIVGVGDYGVNVQIAPRVTKHYQFPDLQLRALVKHDEYHPTSKTGRLDERVPVEAIVAVMGFEPNRHSTDGKSVHGWQGEIDGEVIAVWDYKGTRWSTSGPETLLRQLFGNAYRHGPFGGVSHG